jgi:hypothetical protein
LIGKEKRIFFLKKTKKPTLNALIEGRKRIENQSRDNVQG